MLSRSEPAPRLVARVTSGCSRSPPGAERSADALRATRSLPLHPKANKTVKLVAL